MTDESEPMVIIDRENFQLSWIEQGAPELVDQYWLAYFAETTDDHLELGFALKAKFSFKEVPHYSVDFEASAPDQFRFFPKE